MGKKIHQPLLQKAIIFAAQKHEGQVRKGSTVPYFTHVMEAMEIVSRLTEDEQVRAAAVLHDTLEDTDTTREELIREFGPHVAELVDAESEDKRVTQSEKDTWWVRKKETIKHLSKAGREVKMITLGDKLSNIRSMSRDYTRIGEGLWGKFNNQEPIEHGIYYWLLASALEQDEYICSTPEYREYAALCDKLFRNEAYGKKNKDE